MKDIVIIGAGGCGREVQWLLERINQNHKDTWNILGYVDDGRRKGELVNGYPVLGSVEYLCEFGMSISAVCAIGSPKGRKQVIGRLEKYDHITFPNVVDPGVCISERVGMGKGNIICSGSILTVDIGMADFNIINLDCTIGHDAQLGSYITVYHSANLSGCTEVGDETEIGTGCRVIQGIHIGRNVVLGAGTVVIRNIPPYSTAVGNPAKIIKNSRGGGKHDSLLVIGAGGHGKVVAEAARAGFGYRQIGFLDDAPGIQKTVEILGDSSYVIKNRKKHDVIIAVGNASARKRLQENFQKNGVKLATIIHPYAYVAEDVLIGAGTVVMAGAVIQTESVIGAGVIVNTSASVDHGAEIGDYVHVAVGAHIAGNVTIGEGTWIGAGAVVSNGVSICGNCIIGAGAVVVRDITEAGTYVGIPAKKMK